MDQETKLLMSALYRLLGNKRYLHDFEQMLASKMGDLNGFEKQTIMYLVRDLNSVPFLFKFIRFNFLFDIITGKLSVYLKPTIKYSGIIHQKHQAK